MLPLPLSKKNKTSHLGINHCNVTETNHPALGSICLSLFILPLATHYSIFLFQASLWGKFSSPVIWFYCDGPFRSMELQWTLDRYGFKPSRKISNQPTYRWLFFFGLFLFLFFSRFCNKNYLEFTAKIFLLGWLFKRMQSQNDLFAPKIKHSFKRFS